jgi:hypothetical protein
MESFYTKINFDFTGKTDCWEWAACKSKSGYGKFSLGPRGSERHFRAHRFSYELHKGPITKDMYVCHTCDNQGCVNPEHLWLGTAKDNLMDMSYKGRSSNTKKIQCPKGHPYDYTNTHITRSGSRKCKKCCYDRQVKIRV